MYIFLPLLGAVGYYYSDYYFNYGTWTDLIDNVDCTGTESKLMDCSYDVINQDYYYFYTPDIYCLYGEPKKRKITDTKYNVRILYTLPE